MPFAAFIEAYENPIQNIPPHLIEQVQFDEFKLRMEPGINDHIIARKYFKFSESAVKRNKEKEEADADYNSDRFGYIGF